MDVVATLGLPSTPPLLILWLDVDVGHGRWLSGLLAEWSEDHMMAVGS
jgi:hypothetical protein